MPQMLPIARRGLMLVISSPSGAGKSTIARNLLEDKTLGMSLSISVTTRERRPSEIDGVHYHFITKRQFDQMRDSDQLLEWAEVHGNFYATPREPVEYAMSKGQDMLFDIDWQGAAQMRDKIPADVVSVFVLPPRMAELVQRLKRRAENTEDDITRRLKNARSEIQQWTEYDYIIINDDLDRAYSEVRAIVIAERLRRDRRPGLFDFVNGLLDETI
ncbi:MAG: guanylate kinase [Rhizobiaceae bacterium]|nr:guanylate kinase [Rhizobiaceae bacterium]